MLVLSIINSIKTLRFSVNCIIFSSESCLLDFISSLKFSMNCIIFSSESCLLDFISCFLDSIASFIMMNCSSDLLSSLFVIFGILKLEL